jgi:histidine kinase
VSTVGNTDRARLLHELACAFAARMNLAELVPFVVAQCRTVLHAEGAAVLLLDRQRQELFFPYVENADPAVAARLRELRFPADRGIAGEVLRTARALRVDNVATDPRFYTGVDRESGLTTRNLLSAPLVAREGPIGVIQVLNQIGPGFTDDDLTFLETLAGSIAVAVENARLYGRVKRSAEELEQRVIERTRELQDKNTELERTLRQVTQLQQQLVAQEKLASLGQLTAGIAHEIKNPLNFVTNFAQLSVDLLHELRDELASLPRTDGGTAAANVADLLDDLETNVAKITEHGKRADDIIRSMLQHARAGGGALEPTDLNALVAEALALFQHSLRARSLPIDVVLESQYDPAVGDVPIVAQDVSRVCLNILDNACYAVAAKRGQAPPAYTPTVHVQTLARPAEVEVRIRDNGTGIPAAVRERLFEPFFTTKPPGEGTGLGLSLSYDIVVRQHRGSLRVESTEGQSTEFIITLPRGDTA